MIHIIGDSTIVLASIALMFFAFIFIWLVLKPFHKGLAGLGIMLLGISVSTIGFTTDKLKQMSAITATIIIGCGIVYVLFWFFNRRGGNKD